MVPAQPPHSDTPQKSPSPDQKPDKPWPLSWIVIAILAYILFQVSYIALRPTKDLHYSIHYDRTYLKADHNPPPPATPAR